MRKTLLFYMSQIFKGKTFIKYSILISHSFLKIILCAYLSLKPIKH